MQEIFKTVYVQFGDPQIISLIAQTTLDSVDPVSRVSPFGM